MEADIQNTVVCLTYWFKVTLRIFFLQNFLYSKTQTVLRECKPLGRCLTPTESDPGFKYVLLDVCRIASKMLKIHYRVSASNFAECRENRIVTVWEILINLLKSPIHNDERSQAILSLYPGLQHHQKLISSSDWYRPSHNTKFHWNQLIISAVILLTDRQTDRENKRQTNSNIT